MMARNIAETGVKSLFKCILKAAIYSIKSPQSISLPEGFKQINPQMSHQYLSIKVNVGLGSGRIDEKKAVLQSLIPIQQMIIEKMGPANPMCNWNNVRETIKTLLRLNGIQDYQTYFPFVPPEQLQKIDQDQKAANEEMQKKVQEAQKAQQDAMMALVKVEGQKAELKFQSDTNKLKADFQAKMVEMQAKQIELQTKMTALMAKDETENTKIILDDDRERDKMDMDFAIDVAKVGLEEDKIKATEAKVAAQRKAPNGALQ